MAENSKLSAQVFYQNIIYHSQSTPPYCGNIEWLCEKDEIPTNLITSQIRFNTNSPIIEDKCFFSSMCKLDSFDQVPKTEYVLLGFAPAGYLYANSSNKCAYACLYNTEKDDPQFLNNIEFVKTSGECEFIKYANLCYSGNIYKVDKWPEQTIPFVERADIILQVLKNFDIYKQSEFEQKLLMNIRNNTMSMLLNGLEKTLRQFELEKKEEDAFQPEFFNECVFYYEKSKKCTLSDYINFSSEESERLNNSINHIRQKKLEEQQRNFEEQLSNYKL